MRTGLRPGAPGAPFFFKDHCYLVIPFVLHAVTFRVFNLFVNQSSVAFPTELSIAFATEVVMVKQVGSKRHRRLGSESPIYVNLRPNFYYRGFFRFFERCLDKDALF